MKPTKGLSIPVIWPLLQTICIFAPAERSGPERSSNPSGAEISVDVIFHPKISIDGFTSGLKELDRIQLYFKKVRTAVEGVRAPERIIQLQMSFLLSCEYRCIRHFVGICFPNWGSRKRSISRASSRRRGRVLLESEYSRTRCDTLAITSPSSKCKLYFNMMYIYIYYMTSVLFFEIFIWLGYDIFCHFPIFSHRFKGSQAHCSALCERCRGSDLDVPFRVVASLSVLWGVRPEKTRRSISTHGRGVRMEGLRHLCNKHFRHFSAVKWCCNTVLVRVAPQALFSLAVGYCDDLR